MQQSPIRILVVDDHPIVRDGIGALIANHADLQLLAEATDGQEAIEQFRRTRPDVTLMDLQMPGMTGIDAIQAIRLEFPDARIIVLTTFAGDALAHRALKIGASAYVLKSQVRRELLDTIRAVHRGQRRVHADVAVDIAQHAGEPALTPREVEVLKLAAAGHSNKRIAASLRITSDTAKGHMKSILAKLNASDRTHAVTVALRRGIIDL
jgi:DNA-binding NarL/FixJ family response regulator